MLSENQWGLWHSGKEYREKRKEKKNMKERLYIHIYIFIYQPHSIYSAKTQYLATNDNSKTSKV